MSKDADKTKTASLGETLIERIGNKVHLTSTPDKIVKLNKKTVITRATPVSSETLKENLIVSGLKFHPSSDVFNVLRTKVLSKMQANNWRVLAITSPKENAGKSFSAINLAISIALEENNSVLLADFDFRRPSLQKYFGIDITQGLSDYFYNNSPLSDILIRPEEESLLPDNLVLLPAGNKVSRSAELLSSSKMVKLVRELKTRYSNRIIIIDLPPLLDTADAMTFLKNADAALLVISEGESTVDQIKQSMQLIDEKMFLGAVLNKSTGTVKSSYY